MEETFETWSEKSEYDYWDKSYDKAKLYGED